MKSLKLIYFAILVGMIVFGGATVLLISSWEIALPQTDEMLLYLVPFTTFLGVVLGRVLYKLRLDKLKEENKLKNKLLGLRIALIIKFALVEFSFLIGIVATFLTGNIFYLMISGTLIMYFLTLKPKSLKVKKDLNLSANMSLRFNSGDQVIN